MSDRLVHVHADLDGKPHLVGRLYSHNNKGKETASFEYEKAWLENPLRYSLEPALTLASGQFYTARSLFGSLGDSAPDRWGRTLMKRAEARRAEAAKERARTLYEIDYLLQVHDETRQGALRFSLDPGGPYLANGGPPVPPLVNLPKLLSATDALLEDAETAAELKLLLAPGSSLGGARPKASVREKDGQLAIAKFPKKDDDYSAVEWEYVALELAARAGLNVPEFRLERIAGRSVILVRRFDRSGEATRIPFLSAMSMIGAADNEQHSYLELVDALRQYGSSPADDGTELWRRIVFSILISNTDDHLRNHGFLYDGARGWRLSPLYDVNPVPTDIKERILTTAISEEDSTASLDLAFSVATEFGLKAKAAEAVAAEVGTAVSTWRDVAAKVGIVKAEIDRMASAFEHEDLALALT
ncbi:type II toxin-antitoxin system HipA family toxin [Agrobacterium genomosp. 3]|jgi:serine/threonine-protein kinase HipA|uniref:type II toxin-antitoxin system HipA family toxin n=1 Tax=Agrobacterium TaxID=357 RepID=UPI00021706AA|nr:HipA domain-containing protein [Agrobacterium pusense]EGP54059.1 HipA-like protein [Agrobacterium tumefaciens F2]MCA1867802.1 type II toxin-antitoxin system HipA family toxin [Agrobacterium tomkonis]MCA1878035.1 type II toxin-antitoxin system HipA family toxin [Agrobacterium tumefaciens]MCA1893260.1 type II toxin-antitoxin system HipA family toxin [Agrobacterium tomkonis]OJH51372.1 phosphatidylinositol kinase [Agrobacterium pusense]